MKFNKERNKDYYLYINNGEVIEEEKGESEVKIMSQDLELELKSNEKDLYDKLSQYTNKLPNKKTFNKILICVISVICIFLLFTIAKISKTVSITNKLTNHAQVVEDAYLLSSAIQNSNEYLSDYYNTLSKLITNNNINLFEKVTNIKEMAKKDLNDVKSLDDYIISDSLNESLDILETRFKNIIQLCETLQISSPSKHIDFYNDYASIEIEEQERQMKVLIKHFNDFGIKYEI